MKVLFIYPSSCYSFLKRSFVVTAVSLGISYISAVLKKHGHKTELLVLNRYYGRESRNDIDSCINRFSPSLVCFTCIASEYSFTAVMAKHIKRRYPHIYLLVGGPHPSLNPEGSLSDGFDALCIGEGEYPTLDLVSCLEKGALPSGIPNLWIRQNGGIEKNAPRPFIEDINSLPFPDRQMWNVWAKPGVTRHPVLLSRGCAFECTYCCNHSLKKIAPGDYVRLRRPDNIVAEIKEMAPGLFIRDNVYLETETISANREWAMELCAELKSLNSTLAKPLSFGVNIRVTPDADLDGLFAAMDRCNLRFVNIGLESGSERLRREVLKRNYSNADIINTVESARKHKIKIGFYNMIGIPGETLADFRETQRMNRQCQPDWHATYIFFPYPGTELYDRCVRDGLLRAPINDSMERERAVFGLPGFSKRQINKSFAWFEYDVYRGRKPLCEILGKVFKIKLRAVAGSFMSLDNYG